MNREEYLELAASELSDGVLIRISWHGVCLSKEQGEHENDTLAYMP